MPSFRGQNYVESFDRSNGDAVFGMRVYVNDIPVDILPGMTVRHALISAGLLKEIEESKHAFDEWGNEIGLDAALSKATKIYVR